MKTGVCDECQQEVDVRSIDYGVCPDCALDALRRFNGSLSGRSIFPTEKKSKSRPDYEQAILKRQDEENM